MLAAPAVFPYKNAPPLRESPQYPYLPYARSVIGDTGAKTRS